jgi:type VI secretion system secreted protein VgrG
MELENALLAFLAQGRDLITDNRPLRLRLDHPTGMLEDVLLPQRVYGSEAICGGIEYRVLCVSLDAHLPLKELIALPAAVDIVTDTGELRTVCGIVTEASAGDSDGGLASYQLLIQDALAVMEKRTNTRVFRDMSEIDIVCTLLDEWRRTNAVIAACFEYEMDEIFKLQTYPRREFTMQYNESDAAFIRRLLKRRGICWYFRPAEGDTPSHKLVLFNQSDSLHQSAAATVRFHRDAATEESDAITSWIAVRSITPAKAAIYSWDYKNPLSKDFMQVTTESAMTGATSGSQLSATLIDSQILPPHTADSYEDLVTLGNLAMKRHDYENKCFHGEGGVRAFRAGEYFSLQGHPEIDDHSASDREFVLTSLQVFALNNLPKELSQRVEKLFSRSGWNSQLSDQLERDALRVRIRFNAVRRIVNVVPAFDARVDVPQARMQTAVVVGPARETVYCDAIGRVKIAFMGLRAEDHEHAHGVGTTGTDVDSAWIRVASAWAGPGPGVSNQNGAFLLPRVGSEVLIDFLGGDPDKPIIIGQLFNQVSEPPQFSPAGALPRSRNVSGLRSQEIDGARHSQLRFDDSTDKINAQLMCEHGSSQLNLGFLTDDESANSSRRGEGAELRSERHVAVRGAQGVLVTAEAACSTQMQVDELRRIGSDIARIGKEICERAGEYKGQGSEASCLRELLAIAGGMENRGAPAVAISAPAGLLQCSGADVATLATGEVTFASGKSMFVDSAQSINLRSLTGIRAFANEGGAVVTAASGPVRVSAESDSVELIARRVLEIISNADWINIKAKHGIRINGGGSEIELSASGIRQYTSGPHHVYAEEHHTFHGKAKPLQFDGEMPPHKVCVPCLQIAAQSHSPFAVPE